MTELRDPSALFRPEALAYLDRSADGRVMLARPVSHTVLTGLICAFLVGCVVLASWATYRRSDGARGVLVYARDNVRVHATEAGRVGEVLVESGARVEAGDRLLVVDSASFDIGGVRISSRSAEQLAASVRLLREQKSLLGRRHEARLREIEVRISRVRRQLRVHRDLAKLSVSKRELLEREVKAAKALEADGSVSRVTARRKALELLDMDLSLERIDGERLGLEADLEGLRAERVREGTERAQAEAEIDLKIVEIEERLVRVGSDDLRAIKAPISGVVADLRVGRGDRIEPRKTLMLILPDAREEAPVLEAEVYVPPKAMGFVRLGQPVRLQLEAFPYQKYGFQKGTVRMASESTFLAEDIDEAVGVDGPFYRVRVELAAQSVFADGEARALRPGMTLEANLLGEERSLLAWLFEPAIAAGKRFNP